MKEKRKFTEYTAEFRESSIKLAIESKQPITQTARELGVKESTLHTWISKYHMHAKGNAGYSDEHVFDELKRLRKENRHLKEERDILKKAAAYFAKTV